MRGYSRDRGAWDSSRDGSGLGGGKGAGNEGKVGDFNCSCEGI